MRRYPLVVVLVMFLFAAVVPKMVFGDTNTPRNLEPLGVQDKQELELIINKYVVNNYNYDPNNILDNLYQNRSLLTREFQELTDKTLDQIAQVIKNSNVSCTLLGYSITDIKRMSEDKVRVTFLFDAKITSNTNIHINQYEGSLVLSKTNNSWLISEIGEEKITKFKV
ncbi:MAG: hypothetical protein M0T74_11500 [Desulfitobacterium hafniense]|nr:hypothetical protein [Desulfitobacterium hafniense]